MIGAGSGSGIPPSQSMVVDEEEGTARSRGYEQTKLNKIRVYKHRGMYAFLSFSPQHDLTRPLRLSRATRHRSFHSSQLCGEPRGRSFLIPASKTLSFLSHFTFYISSTAQCSY